MPLHPIGPARASIVAFVGLAFAATFIHCTDSLSDAERRSGKRPPSADGSTLDGATNVDTTVDVGAGTYARYDAEAGTWTMGTSRVEKAVRLRDGVFSAVSLVNKRSGRTLSQGDVPGVEFQISVADSGAKHNGASGGWAFDEQHITTNALGGIDVDITIHDPLFTVTMRYAVWPDTGVIEQSVSYTNRSTSPLVVTDPELFDGQWLSADIAAGHVQFDYFTGGRNTKDALRPLTASTSAGWSLALTNEHYGASDYLQEVVFRDTSHADGVLLGWSHTSAWFGAFNGNGRMQIDAHGANGHTLAPGATYAMPRVHILVFEGDLDDAGNALKDFQYRYKWDLTHERWVGAVKPYLWDNGQSYGAANTFALTQHYRSVGADIWHWDANWYDREGDWKNVTTTNMGDLNAFSSLGGAALMVWLPVWIAQPSSKVLSEHPDWGTSTTINCTTATNLDLSNAAAVDWMQKLLDDKTAEFGESWIWRQDFGGGSWDGVGVDPILAHGHYFDMMAKFKSRHPEAGINVNQCGGGQMSVEAIRFSEIVQTTDNEPGHFSVYTPSYFYPPDKLWGTTSDVGANLSWSASLTELRAQLATAWQWDGNGTPSPTQLEAFRQNADIYHFMTARGLAGRWVKTYHPDRVDRDDRTYYVQRMSRDDMHGVIIPLHAHADPSFVMVYPKGLVAEKDYVVKFQNSGHEATRTGAQWMASGIGAEDWGGDLVWLNVRDYPGAKTDSSPPKAPTAVTKKAAIHLGRTGVAIRWTRPAENGWISYYDVLRNGTPIGRSARATFYFDTAGTVSDTFTVRAVDGDGNASSEVTAVP
ncbi:MAG TPA: hypothetical protein VM925_13835 [Labilithrix sp.]|nr:hypothetical protein [Labilithrix sp.]